MERVSVSIKDVKNTSVNSNEECEKISCEKILFSIIMPTYNSEKTIEKALQSIRMQDIEQNLIEILVIDGGSTDKTIEIAERYGAQILNNLKKFPEYAKQIGFAHAKGIWIVMQDSDEVLSEKSLLSNRLKFFEKNSNVYCLTVDEYLPGEECGIACAYMNWFGDPFSYIVYDLKPSKALQLKKYLHRKSKEGNVYKYKENDIYHIGDGGTTTVNIQKAKELFGEEYYTSEFATSIFYRMIKETLLVGCIPGDAVIHYPVSSFKSYLKKLRFRVYTNLNDVQQSGYSVRAKENKRLMYKKLKFILYVATIILPLIDSVRLSIKYKNISLLLHFVYTYYVVAVLAIEIVKKMLGIKMKNVQYGK